ISRSKLLLLWGGFLNRFYWSKQERMMSFKRKIILILLGVGILPALLISALLTWVSSQSLSESVFDHLSSIRSAKAATVTNYLNTLSYEVEILAQSPDVKQALNAFDSAFYNVPTDISSSQKQSLQRYYEAEFLPRWKEQKTDANTQDVARLLSGLTPQAQYLQYQYISNSSHPVGGKDNLLSDSGNTAYSSEHKRIHPYMRTIQQRFGFYDLFMVDMKGSVVYTVFKELDFATNLKNGPYANSGLADAYNKALNLGPEQVNVTDFSLYVPSYDAPAGFISSPVYENGQKIGVMIAQFPIDELNAVMGERDGLGETGETYLVGKDGLMRSDSYLDPQNHSVLASFTHKETGRVNTEAVLSAQANETGTRIITDYNGNPVLSAFAPLSFAGLGWSILAEMDEAEAMSSRNHMIIISVTLVFIAAVLGIAIALFVARMVLRPLGAEPNTMKDIADRIANGDLTIKFTETNDNSVYRSMSLMSASLKGLVLQIRDSAQHQAGTAHELAIISEQTSGAIREQHANTTQIAAATSQMSSTSGEVSQTIQGVANATREAKQKVTEGVDIAETASQSLQAVAIELEKSGEQVDVLAQQVLSISSVLESIQGISDQTNLLALNAAIEAARAGESGRGFAVVADEVRTLAQSTQQETKQISNIINQLQTGAKQAQLLVRNGIDASRQVSVQTTDTAVKLREAMSMVDYVDEMTLQIASAAEQQSSVSNEISVNVETLSSSSSQIEQTVDEISRSSEEVSRLSGDLNVLVDKFKVA
ncbi:MAG: methyl-accepting chemotaxis protein, partial [Pseudomonadota bacterium]|nr:methyl-accepting chemotaxis protein [Pseudomonadota bacterium]